MHDTAVSIWSTKGWYDCARPITAIRWMCQNGQSSDPALPSYSPNGSHLVPGAIELITPATTAPGQRHAELAGYEGQVAIHAWRGPDWIANPATDQAGVGDRTGPAAFAHAQAMWSALPCRADLDGSGSVDGNDLAQLLAQWGTGGQGNLNLDGRVDGVDLGMLLQAWASQ